MWLLRNFLTLIFMFSLVFLAACEESPKKEEPFKQGSLWGPCYDDGTCDAGLVCKDKVCLEATGDDDLLTDDLVPDEEEDDAKTDTDKVDTDKVDTDKIDNDTKDADTTDADIVTGPCVADPCSAVEHSDGVCTADGDDYSCGCDENYDWNATDKTCDPGVRRTDCTNIPDDAHGIGDNADGKYEQTWDGENWLPASVVCTWECDTNYTLNGNEDGCVAGTQQVDCTNILPHAHGTGANADGKITQTWNGENWLPAADTCTWECDANYTLNEAGDVCVADIRRTDCPNIPANAHGIGANADGKFEQTFADGNWVPETVNCVWECNDNFSLNIEETGCIADTQRVACTNALPDHAQWVVPNADGKFLQTWDGANWMPATTDCAWECQEHYSLNAEEDGCDADTRMFNCSNSLPQYAVWSEGYESGQFEQTWDSGVWSPVTFDCPWECDENYSLNDEEDGCVADTRRTDCANIPDNAHGINANDDGKFEQTWDGTEQKWLPETVNCEWECDTNYTWDTETTTCVADTQKAPCQNIPDNAHGTGDYEEEEFTQTWDGDSWEPADVACTWACDKGYLINGTADGCDFLPILYVDLTATDGANNGSSWEDAFLSLSDALDFAIATQEIWVAAGTYHPTLCPSSPGECADTRFRTFWFVPGVSMYGGFAGNETARDDRDWVANETILSADINEDDAWDDVNKTWLNRTDNTYHVFARGGNVVPTPDHLDGFTIKSGQADGSEYGHGNGGGISLGQDYSLVIANSTFVGNVAIEGGGAIFAFDTPVTVENCTFDRNIAVSGGAIFSYSAVLTVTGCSFTDNRTAAPDSNQRGGAISFQGTLAVTDSEFTGNYASREGAAIAGSSSGVTLTVAGSSFDQNFTDGTSDDCSIVRVGENSVVTVTLSSFADNIGTALLVDKSSLTVSGALFENNSAINAGAMKIGQCTPVSIENSRFIGNQATISVSGLANLGGAIFLYGLNDFPDLAVLPGLNATITNSVFKDNKAGWHGGALAILGYPDLVVSNCTMEGNEDNPNKDATPDPNALSFFSSDGSQFNNSIIWDPVSLVPAGFMGLPIIASNPVFAYSDVFGCGGSGAWNAAFGTDGGGNIDADPLFVGGTGTDPLDLQATSPCVDAGSNALVPEWLTADILGDDRIQSGTVDMGAYEQ